MNVYVLSEKNVTEYVQIKDDDGFIHVVPANAILKITKDENIFTNKYDAQYALFRNRRRNGVPLTNFSRSKYFKYYCDRARDEDPELLF